MAVREVIFRGKRKDNGEWVEGLLWKKKCKTEKLLISCFPDEDDNEELFVISPETVGQYTGLTDKNGKKIFEGDIVNIEYLETTVKNAVIEYVGASFCGATEFDSWELNDYCWLEVIGNIHDNHELMEEKV